MLTRKPDSARAQNLQKQNAELVKGDLSDLSTYRNHLKDVEGVFSVQTFEKGVDRELVTLIEKVAATLKDIAIQTKKLLNLKPET